MTEPCSQEKNIQALWDFADKILGRLDRVADKLEEAATMAADIRHLHEDITRNEKAVSELFTIVRRLELAPGKAMTRIGWITLAAAGGCAGGIISGVAIWIMKGV